MPMFDAYPLPLADLAGVFSVVRFHRDLEGDDRFEALPNIRVESIHFREGATIPSAQFSYVLDDTDHDAPTPYAFEELWPLIVEGPYVVQPDDELLVYHHQAGDEVPLLVFDGFAQIPQVNQGKGLAATFAAVGAHVRLWDSPIANARVRNAFEPESDGLDSLTSLSVHFNPDDVPGGNCTPDGQDKDDGEPEARPLFIDGSATGARPWTLPGMIRYLFWEANPDEEWVLNPTAWTGQTLDEYLQSVIPKGSTDSTFDLRDPDTYDTQDIIIRSFDATGKSLIEAAVEQLGYYGFRLFLNTRPDPDDPLAPINEVILFRVDGRDAVEPKTLHLPPHGSGYDTDGLPEMSGIKLARDRLSTFNEVAIQTALEAHEVSVILAPDFTPASGDASNIEAFNMSALANATAETRKKYRVFVADEDGSGHWDFTGASFVTGEPLVLGGIFGDTGVEPGAASYIARRRPGAATVFTTDSGGRPRRAELAVSRDYSGPVPDVWNRSGTWRSLSDAGWRLLKDRLGIEIVAENPETWQLPKAKNDQQAVGDTLRAITSLASPAGSNTRFYLRLTTVIQGDVDAVVTAGKREASPSRFTARRLIDGREHYKYQFVDKSSAYNASAVERIHRDDTQRATSHAAALRLAHEAMAVAGSLTIPWISHAVGVGDLISGLSGRDVSFAEAGGGAAGEGPQYPAVIGFDWTCQLPQSTTLIISDRRSEAAETDWGDGGTGRRR